MPGRKKKKEKDPDANPCGLVVEPEVGFKKRPAKVCSDEVRVLAALARHSESTARFYLHVRLGLGCSVPRLPARFGTEPRSAVDGRCEMLQPTYDHLTASEKRRKEELDKRVPLAHATAASLHSSRGVAALRSCFGDLRVEAAAAS
jgi:hypothetical protein